MLQVEIPMNNNNTPIAKKGRLNKFFSFSTSFPSSSSIVPSSSPMHSTFNKAMMEENIDNAEVIIMKWDQIPNSSSTSLFQPRKQAKEFLKCVRNLRRAMHFLVSEHSASNKLVLAQNLMGIAMKRLETEFHLILSSLHDGLDPVSVLVSGSEVESSVSNLKLIADCMISTGYSRECVKIYTIIRKSVIEKGLYLLGVEKFRFSQIQKMNWEALDNQIKNWLNAVKITDKTLFAAEKSLCDYVFSASQTIRECCFTEITKESATNLFRFPQLIANCKKSPERIFSLLELHQTLSSLQAEIEFTFNSESNSSIKLQVLSSLHALRESVCVILSDFESTIQKDSSKTLVLGGGIHPLTRTTMNYISSLADHSETLSDILSDSLPPTPLPESYFSSPPSGLVSIRLAWLILVLLCKIDLRAELYKDVALSYLFLANNLQFIIEKVCTSHLKFLLGEDWVLKHDKKVKQYASSYEIMGWNKVFLSLPCSELSAEAAMECLGRFNAAFEEEYKKQSSWIVSDRKLRDEIKISIAKKLIPAYTEFYGKCLVMLNGQKNLGMLLRFCPDDLGNYLSDLFHGFAISDTSSSSSSSSSSSRGHKSR